MTDDHTVVLSVIELPPCLVCDLNIRQNVAILQLEMVDSCDLLRGYEARVLI